MVGNKLVDILWIISLITNILQTTQEEYRILIGESLEIVHATEGDIINLQCTNQTLIEDHYIIWYRAFLLTRKETEQIYRNGTLLTSDLGQEALAYSINSTQAEFTITIAQGLGQYLNLNTYRCEVIETSTGNELIDMTAGSVLLEVKYPPPAPYPLCTSTGYQSDLIGQNVTLTCITQSGNPTITIQWWRNEVMVRSGNVKYNSNMRFTEYSLDYTFTLQQEDLEATYQCRVTWMEDVTTCTVQETSQTTILPTTTEILTTPTEILTTPTWKTFTTPTLEILTTSTSETLTTQTLEILTSPTAGKTTQKLQTSITDRTLENTFPNGTEESSNDGSIITYVFAIPAVICICLTVFLIYVILKKQAVKGKSKTDSDKIHVKYSNKSQGLYRESNHMYHLSASKNQPECMIQPELKTPSDTCNRSDTYAQVVPKSMRNSKLQQVKEFEYLTDDDNGMVDNNIYEGGFEVTESQNESLRNNNMQQDKESECPSEDDHVMVENNIYGGMNDMTESQNREIPAID